MIIALTQFDICSQYIRRIPLEDLNKLFVSRIKLRMVHNLFFNKRNSEINQVCLSLNLNKKDRELLITAVMGVAWAWMTLKSGSILLGLVSQNLGNVTSQMISMGK